MILIIGCTASGKGRLALELARKMSGQIISVDSMKVYRRMDIGTAKPDKQTLSEIPHHLINVVEPSESFSVGRYIQLADTAIDKITQDSNDPIIASGGTAMYIRGMLEGIFDGPAADEQLRQELKLVAQEQGREVLHQQLAQVDPVSADKIHPNDLKRLIRALEVYRLTGKPLSQYHTHFYSGSYRYDWQIIGLRRTRQDAAHRINQRVKRMFQQGLVQEVESLLSEPQPLSMQAAQAVGYAEIIDALANKFSMDKAQEKIKVNTRRFAKQQRTWFRRFSDAHWIDVNPDDTVDKITEQAFKILGR